MDYDDQLVYALQILRTCPEILAEFQARYRWIHVDEAQDTSKIQHEIIRLLVGKRGKLFMVGDEDQSIYGFRAAWPQALMEFERRFSGARVLLLGKNYRSTRQIVSAANRFIAGNRNRREKHMTAVRGSGPEVGQIWVYNRMAQYQYLAKVAGGCEREMAVLFRNNESALPVIDLLDRAGIPYRCRQFDSSFFTHRVVQDVTDIIRFAQAPEDGALFLRLYYKLGTCVTKAAAEQAAARSARTGRPVLQVLSQMEEVSAFSQRRCALLQKELEELPQRNGALAVYHIAGPMGYSRYLSERDADPGKLQILQVLGASEPSPQRLLLRLQELAELVRRARRRRSAPLSCLRSIPARDWNMSGFTWPMSWTAFCRGMCPGWTLRRRNGRPMRKSGGCFMWV